MSRALLRSFLILVVATFLSSNLVMAGAPHRTASTAGGCPSGTACDRALGVALVPAPGWQQMPVGKLPPHTIAKPLRDVLEIFQCRLEHDVPTGLVVQARLVDEGDLAESIAGRSVHSVQHVAKLSGRDGSACCAR